jgi:hypothetical protein
MEDCIVLQGKVMICPSCRRESSHIRIEQWRIGCHNCMGFSETGGSRTDKILTRNASRVTDEQIQYEGDLITPYIVDKTTNQAVVNEAFIDLYPDQAAQTYTAEELKSIGQSDLKPPEDTDTGQGIEFTGDESEAISDIVNS